MQIIIKIKEMFNIFFAFLRQGSDDNQLRENGKNICRCDQIEVVFCNNDCCTKKNKKEPIHDDFSSLINKETKPLQDCFLLYV